MLQQELRCQRLHSPLRNHPHSRPDCCPSRAPLKRGYSVASVITLVPVQGHNTDTSTLKGERFTLAHGIRGFSLYSPGSKAEILWWKGVVEQR